MTGSREPAGSSKQVTRSRATTAIMNTTTRWRLLFFNQVHERGPSHRLISDVLHRLWATALVQPATHVAQVTLEHHAIGGQFAEVLQR